MKEIKKKINGYKITMNENDLSDIKRIEIYLEGGVGSCNCCYAYVITKIIKKNGDVIIYETDDIRNC